MDKFTVLIATGSDNTLLPLSSIPIHLLRSFIPLDSVLIRDESVPFLNIESRGVTIADSDFIKTFSDLSSENVVVIGGKKLYEEVLTKYRYLCGIIYYIIIDGKLGEGQLSVTLDSSLGRVTKYKENGNIISKIVPLNTHQEYQYLNLLRKILEEGESRGDRTGTGTISLFGKSMEFDLREGFPLLTTKRVWWKGIVRELLFFIAGKSDSKILEEQGINIWKGNTSKAFLSKNNLSWREGDMGPMYGWQWRHSGANYQGCDIDYTGKGIDQLSWVINEIKKNPESRRLIISSWTPSDIEKMVMPPCHCMCQFYVGFEDKIPTYLDCQLIQRSGDMFLGVPFNIASYSLLLTMVAHLTKLIPRKMVHVIGDAHIYNNHLEQVTKQLKRVPYPLPRVSIDTDQDSIDNISEKEIILENYISWEKIEGEMSI